MGQETKHYVRCHECNGAHAATYSHEGRFGEGAIYAVVCPEDGLTGYYTSEALDPPGVYPPGVQAAIRARLEDQ